MNSKIAVVTDSNSSMTIEEAKDFGITMIPMPFFIGGKEYLDGVTITQDEFYERLKGGEEIHTSQPSPEVVMNTWDELLKDHDEIIHIPMSSGLSGSCGSAYLLAQHYDDKVHVVDNQRISVTLRQSCLDALELIGRGMNGRQIKDELERVKFESSIYIMIDTLEYLKKGGRLTPAAAAIGTLLKIKPVLQIQGEKLDSFAKTRTFQGGKDIMKNAIKKDMETRFGCTDRCHNVHLEVAYTDNPQEGEKFKAELLEMNPCYDIVMRPLSLSISCHIGPGALACAVSKKI
jgi:DegV family protein with EDD domain